MASGEVKNIVVTGFGLFKDHKANPSWECIRDNKLIIDRPQVNLITKQVDVCYDVVDQAVDSLWHEHKPWLMVHVGLAAHETGIRLERLARAGPYVKDDIKCCAPHKQLVQDGDAPDLRADRSSRGFEERMTCLNVDKICDTLESLHAQGKIAMPVKVSQDAGLYLCEYIYHKSLLCSDRAVFIHVPSMDRFRPEDITSALKYTIEAIIDDLCDCDKISRAH